MRLAFYTYSYTDRLDMPIEPALEKIAATGYDGIDISGTHGPSADPQSVTPELRTLTRATADRLGLTVEAIITHASLANSLYTDEPLDLKGSVDLAIDTGAPLVVFHMGGPGEDGPPREDMWRRVVDYLKAALDHAAPRNIKLAVDGVWHGWLTDTPAAFLQLHDEVGSDYFGVNFDPCYLALRNYDPVAVAQQWQHRIFHAHLKDHVGTYTKWDHKIPGQGDLDYPRIVRGLKDIGFSEAISIETFVTMDFDEACEVGYTALAPSMGKTT